MWKWLKTKQSGFMGFNGIKVRSAPWRRGDRDRTDAPLPSPPPPHFLPQWCARARGQGWGTVQPSPRRSLTAP